MGQFLPHIRSVYKQIKVGEEKLKKEIEDNIHESDKHHNTISKKKKSSDLKNDKT